MSSVEEAPTFSGSPTHEREGDPFMDALHSHVTSLKGVIVVATFCQAMALKCYQAPLSWEPCWKDPSGEHHGHSM